MKHRTGRALAAAAAASLTVLTVGVAPAQAEETGTQTVSFDLGDLDLSGSGVFDQFDPALGTLTAVELTADVTMDFAVCVTNLSEEAAAVNTGSASGTAEVAFAGDVVAQADGALVVPGSELGANEGVDGCADWEAGGGNPAVDPAGANSSLTTGSETDSWSATLTEAAEMAPYIGTGTVGFDYSAGSASDLAQPAEWTLVFLAGGSGEASVTYTYEPGDIGGICETDPSADECDEGGTGGLPDTGGPDGWLLPVGVGLVLAGAGIVMVRRPHSA